MTSIAIWQWVDSNYVREDEEASQLAGDTDK